MKSLVVSGACALLFVTISCASKPSYKGDSGTTTGTGGSSSTGTGGTGTGGAVDECGGANGLGGLTGEAGSDGAGGAGGDTTGGGGAAPLTITSADFGEFNNAFMITPCQAAGTGYDCPNRQPGATSCPTALWAYGSVQTTEATGSTYDEVFKVTGGDPSKVYTISMRVVGQAEGRTYTGGERVRTTNVDPTMTNDMLYKGGRPGTTRVDYNVFQMVISPPKCTPGIPGEPTYYAFNAVDTGHEGQHFNYSIASDFTFKVKSGYTITLTSHDSNCIAIKNCGSGGPYNFSSAALCEAAARDTASEVTLPATFRGQAITSPTRFQTQFLNFKVMSITAN